MLRLHVFPATPPGPWKGVKAVTNNSPTTGKTPFLPPAPVLEREEGWESLSCDRLYAFYIPSHQISWKGKRVETSQFLVTGRASFIPPPLLWKAEIARSMLAVNRVK